MNAFVRLQSKVARKPTDEKVSREAVLTTYMDHVRGYRKSQVFKE